MRIRHLVFLAFLGCGETTVPREVPPTLLLLPTPTVSPVGNELQVRVRALHVKLGAGLTAVPGNTLIHRLEVLDSMPAENAVNLDVVLGGTGTFSLQQPVPGGAPIVSNRLVVKNQFEPPSGEAPAIPDLMQWTGIGGPALLVLTNDSTSVLLTDPDGRALTAGDYKCTRPEWKPIEPMGVQCTVTRRKPLETTGYPYSSVRAIAKGPEGLVLTRLVELP